MHHSACKMLGWGHLEEPTDSRNLRALPSPHFPPLWKVHASPALTRVGFPASLQQLLHPPPHWKNATLPFCSPPGADREGDSIWPHFLWPGEAIWEMRNPLALPPLWEEAALPLCTFSTSSQTHSPPTCSYVVNSPRSSLHPPPRGARAGKGASENL